MSSLVNAKVNDYMTKPLQGKMLQDFRNAIMGYANDNNIECFAR